MKVAIVLSMDSPSVKQQAGEINDMLKHMAPGPTCVELWMFYTDTQPDFFPEFSPKIGLSLSDITLIALKQGYLPESYLQVLSDLTDKNPADKNPVDQAPVDVIIFPSDGLGKELATRLAYRTKGSSCLQVQNYCLVSGRIEVTKPVYGNNLQATFILENPPYCLSAAKRPCAPVKMIPIKGHGHDAKILSLNQAQGDWVKEILKIPDQSDTGLADADLLLIVGQGAKNKDTVDILQGIATSIGAALGASRPVVMNAWTDMDRLIGTSGLLLSPKLCITAGVSGTAVFTAGIKASEFIVAINTDSKAPIFQIAHVGIVGELQPILLELEKVILDEKDKKILDEKDKKMRFKRQ